MGDSNSCPSRGIALFGVREILTQIRGAAKGAFRRRLIQDGQQWRTAANEGTKLRYFNSLSAGLATEGDRG